MRLDASLLTLAFLPLPLARVATVALGRNVATGETQIALLPHFLVVGQTQSYAVCIGSHLLVHDPVW